MATHNLEKSLCGTALRVLARILTWQGYITQHVGRLQDARKLLEQCLALLKDPALAGADTRAERAEALYRMAYLAGSAGDWEEGARFADESLKLYKELGDQWWTARVLVATSFTVADARRAKHLVEESLAIGQSLGDRSGEIANALSQLSDISMAQGLFQEAENVALEMIAVKEEIDDRFGVYAGHQNLGQARFWRADFRQAELIFGDCLAGYRDLGLVTFQAAASFWLGWTNVHLGKYVEARACGDRVLTLARDRAQTWIEPEALGLLGLVALALVEEAEARQLLEEGLSLGPAYFPWLVQIPLGLAAIAQRQPVQAQRNLYSALLVATEAQDIRPLMYILPAVALSLVRQDAVERAVELYGLASRFPHVAKSRWFEDVAVKHVSAAAATLSPDVVSAARERGRARDLWSTAQELLAELESKADDA
jgi:tetratricopeptide (TPR) repeat protein